MDITTKVGDGGVQAVNRIHTVAQPKPPSEQPTMRLQLASAPPEPRILPK